MPLDSGGAMVGGNLPAGLQGKIGKIIKRIDFFVGLIAKENGLYNSQIKLLKDIFKRR